jgi:preprotein translocase subunit SecB
MAPIGPFIDPVPPDVLKQVAEVIPKVEVRDIRVTGLTCALKSLPESSQVAVTLGNKVEAAQLEDNVLVVRVHYSITAKVQEAATDFMAMSVTFQLTYEGEKLNEIDEEKWTSFADVNAVFNSWAYLRELVQSISSRMGIPPLMLPLLKTRQPKTPNPAITAGSPEAPS